jgi:hypothetical protein
MTHLFLHRSMIIRFLSMYVLALVLFLVAWTISYFLLSEGVLRGRTGAQILAGSEAADSFLDEWLRISLINLTVGCLFVVGPNFIRSQHGYPLGYLTPLTWAILYAVYLGTNSFTFPMPDGKMPPSIAVLGRSGPYEIAAFILASSNQKESVYKKTMGRSRCGYSRTLGCECMGSSQNCFAAPSWVGNTGHCLSS